MRAEAATPGAPGERAPAAGQEESDEALMRRLAAGHQEALEPLHRRYAALIFHLAAQTLGPTAAEEVLQEVFVAVWRKASTFDPQRGPFRSWVLQVAHTRVLNELRRQRHRPQVVLDPDGRALDDLIDGDPEPEAAAWAAYRRAAVRAAVAALPPPQRRALGLAFFGDLTHEQVAAVLQLPLGTAKTRIRAALHTLRRHLAPVLAAGLLAALSLLDVRWRQEQSRRALDDRALQLVTTSDVLPVRLVPSPGLPEATHGTYRGRPGTSLAVLTFSALPPAPAGQGYRAWVRHEERWTPLGAVVPDGQGSARLIAAGAALATPPDAVWLTLEPGGDGAGPRGPLIVSWTPAGG